MSIRLNLSLGFLLVTCHLSLVTFLVAAEPLAKGIQDNSFFVEEAYNQEPGVVQHIGNIPAFFAGDDRLIAPTFTQEWPVFSQTHQFSYTVPYSFTNDENGFADVRLNYRLQALMESDRVPAFAPRLTLVLPTGDSNKGFGTDHVGYETNLPFSKIVADRWTVHFNAGGSIFPGVRGRDLKNYLLGGSVIYAVSRDFNLMLESVAVWSEEIADATPSGGAAVNHVTTALISPGARYAFNFPNGPQFVVGLGVPIGLTSDSPDWGVFVYLSFEHAFTRARE